MKKLIAMLSAAALLLTAQSQAAEIISDATLENYIAIEQQLAADSIEGVSEKAKEIAAAVQSEMITQSAQNFAEASDLEKARAAFQKLSAAMIDGLKDGSLELASGEAHLVHCPMAKASWLQTDKEIKNPYYGSSMLKCGAVKETFAKKS